MWHDFAAVVKAIFGILQQTICPFCGIVELVWDNGVAAFLCDGEFANRPAASWKQYGLHALHMVKWISVDINIFLH